MGRQQVEAHEPSHHYDVTSKYDGCANENCKHHAGSFALHPHGRARGGEDSGQRVGQETCEVEREVELRRGENEEPSASGVVNFGGCGIAQGGEGCQGEGTQNATNRHLNSQFG